MARDFARLRRLVPRLGLAAIVGIVSLGPLLAFVRQDAGAYLARAQQVSLWAHAATDGEPVGALLASNLRTYAGAFNVFGDVERTTSSSPRSLPRPRFGPGSAARARPRVDPPLVPGKPLSPPVARRRDASRYSHGGCSLRPSDRRGRARRLRHRRLRTGGLVETAAEAGRPNVAGRRGAGGRGGDRLERVDLFRTDVRFAHRLAALRAHRHAPRQATPGAPSRRRGAASIDDRHAACVPRGARHTLRAPALLARGSRHGRSRGPSGAACPRATPS